MVNLPTYTYSDISYDYSLKADFPKNSKSLVGEIGL